MFLHVLDPDEAEVFVDAAWHLIHIDGDVDDREEVLLAELQTELGLDPLPHRGLLESEVTEQLQGLGSGIVERVVLLELAGISLADGTIHDSERAFLRTAARTMGHEERFVDECLEFAARAQGVWSEGRALVLGDD